MRRPRGCRCGGTCGCAGPIRRRTPGRRTRRPDRRRVPAREDRAGPSPRPRRGSRRPCRQEPLPRDPGDRSTVRFRKGCSRFPRATAGRSLAARPSGTGIFRSLGTETSKVALRPRESPGMPPPRPARPEPTAPPRATSVGRLLANSSLAHFPPRNLFLGALRPRAQPMKPGPHPAITPHLPHCAQVEESSADTDPPFAMCHLWSEVMFMFMSENRPSAGHRDRDLDAHPPPPRGRSASRTEGTSPFRGTGDTGGQRGRIEQAGGCRPRHGRKNLCQGRQNACNAPNRGAAAPEILPPTAASAPEGPAPLGREERGARARRRHPPTARGARAQTQKDPAP